jgi:HEAT repeat protein
MGPQPLSQDAEAQPAAAQAAQLTPAQREFAELVAQSARTSFNARSAELALAALTAGLDPAQRPVALFALGASGERAMVPRLESWAVEGTGADRRAAILGIVESGYANVERIARLARSSVTEVREAALLALARMRGEAASAALDALCQDGAPDPATARLARTFGADPMAAMEFETGRTLLRLRWDAARRMGLIDGEPWRERLLSDLIADPLFLDAVVLGAASRLRRIGIADHFLEVALIPGEPSRLRAVVSAIPNELDRMIGAGVWYPTTQEEWAQLLYEIDDFRLESLTIELLRQARAFPDLSAHAAVLLVRAGNNEGLSMLELDFASPDPQKRERIAETLGGTRQSRYVDLLETLRADEDPRVRAAALFAQMRLGHVLSVEAVRTTLAGAASDERSTLVSSLARLAYLPEIAGLLNEYVERLDAEERLTVAIALGREGSPREIATLRAALGESVLRSAQGARYVQALVRVGSNDEIARLFDLFPLEAALQVNVEIALAMCARRDAGVLPLLRSALWQPPFERSVLAAALMQSVSGIDSLRLEVERPPKRARPADVRRVGYALGSWGGTDEVERLGRRRTAADPALQGALLGALSARTH